MRGLTRVIVQTHQILRLPRKMNLMIDPCHTWNAIYNARSNKCHCPNSPNTAPATQNDSPKFRTNFSKTAETSFTMRAGSEQDPTMIRAGSDHETVVRNPPRNRGYFSRPPRAFCIEKYNVLRSGYHSKFHRILRLPRKVRLQHHQILRLPRKVTVMTDPRHIWNVIYNARNNRWHPPTSPNTAPATHNDSPTFQRNFSKTAETSFPKRGRFEHDPSRIRAWNRHSATRLATEVTFRAHHEHFVLKNTTFRAPAIIPNFTEYCACHEKWHFNFTEYCACHEKWLSWLLLVTYETLFTMRGTTDGILQHHRILRLPRKMTLQQNKKNSRKQLKRHFQCGADPSMIRAWSEQDPSMKPSLRNPPRNRGYFPETPICLI